MCVAVGKWWCIYKSTRTGGTPGAIFIKHLRGKLKLRENFGTELQHYQRTLQSLVVMVGCRSNSVLMYVICFQIMKKKQH